MLVLRVESGLIVLRLLHGYSCGMEHLHGNDLPDASSRLLRLLQEY